MKQISIKAELIKLRNHAIKEALVNLGRYKFDRFGYFAARYVVLNGLLRGSDDHMKENPFRDLVYFARKEVRERFPDSWNTAAWESNQTSSCPPSKVSSCEPGYSTGAAILPQHESKGFMRENKKPWDPWTDDEIRDLYDMNPGIDMQQLALVTMLSIAELKKDINGEPMSFDDYLKLKDHAQQLRILVEKNAWRAEALIHWSCINSRNNYKQQYAADGVRLAELMNPIPESL